MVLKQAKIHRKAYVGGLSMGDLSLPFVPPALAQGRVGRIKDELRMKASSKGLL